MFFKKLEKNTEELRKKLKENLEEIKGVVEKEAKENEQEDNTKEKQIKPELKPKAKQPEEISIPELSKEHEEIIIPALKEPEIGGAPSQEFDTGPLFISQSKFFEVEKNLSDMERIVDEFKKETEKLNKSLDLDKDLLINLDRCVAEFSDQILSFEKKMGKGQ